jgi:hypothetical protein
MGCSGENFGNGLRLEGQWQNHFSDTFERLRQETLIFKVCSTQTDLNKILQSQIKDEGMETVEERSSEKTRGTKSE